MAVLADEEARADERLFLAADDADADADADADDDEEEDDACADVEGVDTYHACYGGTAALLACSNWAESRAWDGRWAIAVCTDVSDAPAQYAFMNGAAAVAVLVGPRAPLVMQTPRVSCVLDEWDFYKPVGWPSMGPIIDGPHSKQVYYDCLVRCQRRMRAKAGYTFAEDNAALVFHLGGGPTFVRHAFEEAAHAARTGATRATRDADVDVDGVAVVVPTVDDDAELRDRFERRVQPSPRGGAAHRADAHRGHVRQPVLAAAARASPRAASTSASSRLGRAPRPRCSGCGSTATAAGRWPTRG